MSQTRYQIFQLSAHVVMSYAVETTDGYCFDLSASATEKCKIRTATHEQDSNALFFQTMCVLRGDGYAEPNDGTLILSTLQAVCLQRPDAVQRHAHRRCGHIHTSFQIRLPYVKGMLHQVDFHTFLTDWQEFLDYTGLVAYKADGKKDTTWLGRFTFEALREFGGLSRILTILARGFLFHGPDGTELDGQPRERMAYARRGLCAWCSMPERTGAKPEWQYRTDFGAHHREFPALVDEDGRGWFCRHFHAAMAFARNNPKVVRKAYSEAVGALDKRFDAEWRKKVRQFQMPLFSSNADAAWILRFDDVFADALELGPLRRDEVELPEELEAKIETVRPEKLPTEVIYTLIAYYAANRPEDSNWVVLPVANFDCWFGDTNFGRKYLSQIPEEIIQRSSSFGVSRYRVLPEFLP